MIRETDNPGSPIIQPMRTALIEGNRLVRNALSKRLSQYSEIELVDVRPFLPKRSDVLSPLDLNLILLGMPQHSLSSQHRLWEQVNHWTKSGISVIALTPYIDDKERDDFFAVGGTDYLLKTINSEQLVERVSQIHINSF